MRRGVVNDAGRCLSSLPTGDDNLVITSYSIHYTKLYEMSGDTGESACFRPSSVPVHDNGEVFRKKLGFEFRDEFGVG